MPVAELDETVTDWCEILYGVVPETHVLPCYIEVARHSDSLYTITGQDLLRVYKVWDAGAPRPPRPCEFCRMHAYDPTEYLSCPFHDRSNNAT